VAGISTEHLAELIEQSNRRQDEANERVADELRELRREFHDFRVDVAQRMGQIQASLEGFRGRTETGFKVGASVALEQNPGIGVIRRDFPGLRGRNRPDFPRNPRELGV